MTSSLVTTPRSHRDPGYFCKHILLLCFQWKSAVRVLFEFDSLASHHSADLPSSSQSTQFRYNHRLQSQARAHFIYFIAFLRTFPSGGRGQVGRIEKRSHIWQRIQSCKIPRRHTGHAGYFEWFSCRAHKCDDGEVWGSDFLWPYN